MTDNKSPHILNTSSNLLGFCLIVLTSLKISKFREETLIDEMTGIACILLVASSLFSFLSIRATREKNIIRHETIADNIFVVALCLIFLVTFLVAFSVAF